MTRTSVRAALAMLLLGGAALGLSHRQADAGEYHCAVGHVIDGDTFAVPFTCLPGEIRPLTIRLRDVDAPETRHARCPRERDLGDRATALTRHLLEDAAAILIVNPGPDRYRNRRVADVILVSGKGERRSLAEMLVVAGLAKPWRGGRGPKPEWCGR